MDADNRNRTMIAAGAGLAAAAVMAGIAVARRRRGYDFAGRTVLITGGSRGLGLVMARQFGAEGANLVICARDGDELERAREDVEDRGISVLPAVCDVTDRDQVERLVAAATERFGQVDVLINNAGVIEVAPMEVQTLADYEEAMKTHFWAPLYTTLAVLPQMRERGEGRIVNIASIGGKISVPHLLPYSASKFALVGLSEGLRAELAKDGISVTTVCPGLMRTGSPRNAIFKGQHEAEYAWFTIGDSLPGSSVSAESAARQIVGACRRGDAEIVISVPAQMAVLFHGMFPGITADVLGVVNRFLPAPGGIGTERRTGAESESAATQNPLTGLTRQAEAMNNQLG